MKRLLMLLAFAGCAETHYPWVRQIPLSRCVLGQRFEAKDQDCACLDVKTWPTNTRINYYDACQLVCGVSIDANACVDDKGSTWSACAWNGCGMFGEAACPMSKDLHRRTEKPE